MKKTSASIPIPFLQSLKQNSGRDYVASDGDYLLAEVPQDRTRSAAHGIATLFKLFPYELHTFQFIKTDNQGKTHSPVKTFTDPKAALKTALSFSNDGYDVFFMVNEGDGIVHEGKRVCRSQASVKHLSRCFIDTDNCPVEKVSSYLELINLVPHLIVESSPGRFHFYFFFEPVDKTDDNIQQWKAIQQILHRLGDPSIHSPAKQLGTDATMHDYSKVLRVPGFVHVKKLTLSKITTQNDIPDYTLEELFNLTNANSFLTYHNGHAATIDNVPDLNGDYIYQSGERYQALQSLTMSMGNDDLIPQEDHYITFHNFVIHRLDNSDGVYLNPDKSLTAKSLALFNSAFSKRQREVRQEKSAIVETLGRIDEPKPSPWELPDSFYLSAPNGFGDVVRQVMQSSMYPCAALAFGTFLTGLSILRAKKSLTPGGSSPAVYTLNVAISGYGKGDPMTMLQNTFVANGLSTLIENEIRSDRGIYEHLKINNGMGFFLLDEVAPLLRAIQKEEAATHHANISAALLRLYSAGAMKGVSFGKVAKSKNKNEKPIVVDNPMIALCSFTVPHEFNTLFNIESVNKGLCQRFIPIVPEIRLIPENPDADKHAVIKSPLFESFIEAEELPKTEDGEPVPPLKNIDRTKSVYTPESRSRFQELSKYYRSEMIKAAQDKELQMLSGLYSRVAEQIERIATTLSQDEIDLTTLEYAVSFMESRHRALMATAEGTILRGVGANTLEKERAIIAALARVSQEQESATVTRRDVYQRVRRHCTSMREFNGLVDELVQQGKIEPVRDFKKKNEKSARATPGIKLLDVIA